jgi:hypothetical protein
MTPEGVDTWKVRLLNHRAVRRRAIALGVVLAGLAVSPAFAAPERLMASRPSAVVDAASCADPLLMQPFLAEGDANEYVLVPGQSPDNFDGAGWTLSGGAHIVSTTLADGTTGAVLELPTGSAAVSPTVCVQEDYPDARAMIKELVGSHGVLFRVSYTGGPTSDRPQVTGLLRGGRSAWSLSDPVNVKPQPTPGWQAVRFTLEPNGSDGVTQVYDFSIDPRMKW